MELLEQSTAQIVSARIRGVETSTYVEKERICSLLSIFLAVLDRRWVVSGKWLAKIPPPVSFHTKLCARNLQDSLNPLTFHLPTLKQFKEGEGS